MERTKHMQKLRKLLNDRAQMTELIRYLIAGVLTTLLSLVITYGCEFLFAMDRFGGSLLRDNNVIKAFIDTINSANTVQVMISTLISWVVSVIFAFWINRRMVFRVQGGTRDSKTREFLEFVGARLVSWAVIEEGIAVLIKWMGVSNLWNRLIVLVLVTIFNYVASKFWIFKARDKASPDGQANLTSGAGETGLGSPDSRAALSAPEKTER